MNDYGLWLPGSASTFAAEIDGAINLVHLLMLLMLISWGIFFIMFLVRFRQGSGRAVVRTGFPKMAVPVAMIAFVAIFDTIMLAKDVPFWRHLKQELPSPEESTVVRVVAQQFAWNIHYPGADGIFGRTDPHLVNEQSNPVGLDRSDPAAIDDIVTLGELHLPDDRPVLIYLSTKDVIHSFSLPIMRVKQDVIPGMTIPIWFEPTRTGSWQIACAQLCGNSHYRMKGILEVETAAEFEAWMAERAADLAGADEEVW